MSANIGALVLAAGFSNRFGSIKLCAKLANEQTVFQQTLDNIRQSLSEILVITRAEVSPLIVDNETDIRVFDDAEQGMGATLAFGIRQLSLQDREPWDGCLICLADMPFIQPQSYSQIAIAIKNNQIVVPYYLGKAGNPAGFGCEFFDRLSNLKGDQGGRRVVRENPDSAHKLELNDPAILYDIDTPEDLARYSSR
jgi:molybdenum cofactor cytidylyltransferase